MTATVVTLTLCATRQADVTNVLTVSRAETVTMTSTSATTTPVTNTPTAVTQSVLSSVSARPDTHSTTQPSVKVCSCKPAPMMCHGVWCAHRFCLKSLSAGARVIQIHYKQQRLAYIICTQTSGAVLWRQINYVCIHPCRWYLVSAPAATVTSAFHIPRMIEVTITAVRTCAGVTTQPCL